MRWSDFSDEFKRHAVTQITERGYPVAEVSQRLGVSQHSLYAWKRQLGRQVSGDAGKDAEIRQLKRELARVTEERDILKKPPRIPPGMQSEIGVHCRASRSFWRAGNVPIPPCAAEWLPCMAEEPAEPAGSGRYSADGADPTGRNDSGKVYGYAKLHDDLLDHGETCCPNRVARLTRLAGIKAQIGYKRRPVSYGGKPSLVIDNTLDRQFDVAAPHRAWVTDITYIRTLEGFAYLAVVIDLYSRRVVGWSMQSRQTTDVVLQVLHMAVWRRKPKQRY